MKNQRRKTRKLNRAAFIGSNETTAESNNGPVRRRGPDGQNTHETNPKGKNV